MSKIDSIMNKYLKEKNELYCVVDSKGNVLDISGDFVDPKKCAPDEVEYFDNEREAAKFLSLEKGRINSKGTKVVNSNDIY
jgi:hypothetical protein